MKNVMPIAVLAALCAATTAQERPVPKSITLPFSLAVTHEKVATYCADKGGSIEKQTVNSLSCRFETIGRGDVVVAGLILPTNSPAIEVRYTLTQVSKKSTRVTWSTVPPPFDEVMGDALNFQIHDGLQESAH